MNEEEPKRFLDRQIHWSEPGRHWFGLGDGQIGSGLTYGLWAGGLAGLMPFYDWPLEWRGILFSAAGFSLTAVCAVILFKRANFRGANQRETFRSKEDDPAP